MNKNINEKYSEFLSIIHKWLTIRDNDNGIFWIESSEEDSFFPKYVMRMIREINELMPEPMLDKIKQKEIIASGHIDYSHKFALYCNELYEESIKKQIKQ